MYCNFNLYSVTLTKFKTMYIVLHDYVSDPFWTKVTNARITFNFLSGKLKASLEEWPSKLTAE